MKTFLLLAGVRESLANIGLRMATKHRLGGLLFCCKEAVFGLLVAVTLPPTPTQPGALVCPKARVLLKSDTSGPY